MNTQSSQIVSGILLGVMLIPTTWLFFGPVAGFHHMIGFGLTFYLILNGEDPQAGDPMWGDYAVRFFPVRLLVGVALWLVAVLVIFRVVRFLQPEGMQLNYSTAANPAMTVVCHGEAWLRRFADRNR